MEIIYGRLYWASAENDDLAAAAVELPWSGPCCTHMKEVAPNIHTFNVDQDEAFAYDEWGDTDFGPLDLASVVRFSRQLEAKLVDPELERACIVHWCGKTPESQANAALLMCAFQILVLLRSAEEAWQPFSSMAEFSLPAFCDTNARRYRGELFEITVLQCLRTLDRTVYLGWLDYSKFSCEQFDRLAKPEVGDISEIIPGRLFVMAAPENMAFDEDGNPQATPEIIAPTLSELGVTDVVQVNTHAYDKDGFTDAGFTHHRLPLLEGPLRAADIDCFNTLMETAHGGVVVHCKAGLGRSAALAAIFVMNHFLFNATELIAWFRLCRPGSLMGVWTKLVRDMELAPETVACQRRVLLARTAVCRRLKFLLLLGQRALQELHPDQVRRILEYVLPLYCTTRGKQVLWTFPRELLCGFYECTDLPSSPC